MSGFRSTHDRFWVKVDKVNGPEIIPGSPCWPYMGARDSGGYGSFAIRHGESALAHRYAFEDATGQELGSDHCLHRCDFPACCRPDHLFRGSHQANMKDKAAKGRVVAPSGDDHWLRRHPERAKPFNTRETAARGERSGRARLPASEVARIVKRVADGESAYAVGKELGITLSTVYRFCSGVSRPTDSDPADRARATARIASSPRARKGLSDRQLARIRDGLRAGESQDSIARAVGVSQTLVSDIHLGRAYAHG